MSDPPETRASLLVRLRDAQDGESWSQFVEIYAPLVYGFARKHGLQDADAADVTQDVLGSVASAVQHLDYDPRRGSFRGWLFTVVRNKLRNRATRQDPYAQGTGQSETRDRLEEIPAPDDEQAGWDREYEQHLLDWASDRVQQTVEPSTWQAFWATAVDGRRPSDVARELGMTVANVYRAKSRVLARLKDQVRQLEQA